MIKIGKIRFGFKCFTTGEVAEIFGKTKQTIRRWCEKDDLSFFLTKGNHRRILETSVQGKWQTYFIRTIPEGKGVKKE